MKRILFLLLGLGASLIGGAVADAENRTAPLIGAQVFVEPGQTPEEIDGYFRTLAENGMTVSRIRLFGSHILRPGGNWDFSLYDTAFDSAEKWGIKLFVTLFPPTDPFADVGGFKFPFSKAHLEEIRSYIDASVGHFKDHPALYAWVLQNEPGSEGKSFPESDLLEELREEWSSRNLQSRPADYEPLRADFDEERFHNWCIDWYLGWICDQVRKQDKVHGTHANPHQLLDNLKEYDFRTYEDFLTSLGVSMHLSWHFGYFDRCQFPLGISVMSDIIRSAAGNNPFWITEMQGGNVIYSGRRVLCPTAPEISQWLWTGIGAGAEGVIFWMLNPRAAASESGEWALTDYLGEPSDRLLAAADVAAVLKENSGLFAEAVPVRSDITILYNKESLWAQARAAASVADSINEGRKSSAVIKSLLGAYEAISAWGTVPDVCELQDYDWSSPEGKCVVLPDMISLPSDCTDKLDDFVRNGGRLIATGLTGYYNEGRQCMFMGGKFPLKDCFGASVREFKADENGYFTMDMAEPGLKLPAHLWKGILKPETAEVIAYDGENPVAVRNTCGSGEVIWIPSLIELGGWHRDIMPLAGLYGHWCAPQIASAPLSFTSPVTNVVMRQMVSGNRNIAVIVNKNTEPVELRLNRRLPRDTEFIYGSAEISGDRLVAGPDSCTVIEYE